MLPPEKNTLLNTRIRQLIDESINEQGMHELDLILQNNPEARKYYLEQVRIHAALHRWASRQHPLEREQDTNILDQRVQSIDELLRDQKKRSLKIALVSAAAILLLSLALMRLFFVDSEQAPSLAFQTSPGSLFTITHDSSHTSTGDQTEGQTMHPGSRLQLSQGAIELTFSSGVTSVITAPADLTLHADDQLYLGQGHAWFHVPKGAEGFQVTTRDLNIIDLGTEFGVLAKTNDHDEVHVLKGKVQVTALRVRKESDTLTAGQARRIDPVGRLNTIPVAARTFHTTLPKSLPHLHWSFDGDHPFLPQGSLSGRETITAKPVQNDSREANERLVPGKHGKALSFNGKGDRLLTNWPGILGRQPRSVACWIKLHPNDPHGWAPIVEWGKMTSNRYWRFRVTKAEGDPKRAVLRLGLGQSWYDGNTNLADGKWHHVAVVDTGDLNEQGTPDIRFYVDGQDEPAIHQKSSQIVHTRKTEEGLPMILGINHRQSSAQYQARFHGLIDELFIYRATLTPASIQQIMETHQP
ncbi:FecR domain-containing protein [Verrucomicrobiaceae bacterium N1E253]|uniref:FecR domain-containing protein n=1 Tax=Oceaniferula marina TaxID=2748318 RepID=A0A851GD02_9BACT|nr:LamG-like jellyroll fold domain-containing protein [Oceaniferula marina]NWK55059.1 FecR domain-containing protein [Oceaniferula marina]